MGGRAPSPECVALPINTYLFDPWQPGRREESAAASWRHTTPSANMFGKGGRKGGARDSTHAFGRGRGKGGRGKGGWGGGGGRGTSGQQSLPNKVSTLEGHQDTVAALAVSHARSQLFSGSGDGTVKIWDWSAGFKSAHARIECRATTARHVHCVAS